MCVLLWCWYWTGWIAQCRLLCRYTRLILDVFRGKQSGFVRDDELEAAWKIFTPLLQQLDDAKVEPIKYPFGVRGLEEADELFKSEGFKAQTDQYVWVDPSSPQKSGRK